jgi:hypothetical protein
MGHLFSKILTFCVCAMYIECMKLTVRLSTEDRIFFGLVSRAAFSNPFSDDRVELDLRIARCSGACSDEERVQRVIHAVRERIGRLEAQGGADLRLFASEDQFMMQSSFLFDVFHFTRWLSVYYFPHH